VDQRPNGRFGRAVRGAHWFAPDVSRTAAIFKKASPAPSFAGLERRDGRSVSMIAGCFL
jgi:hypothetical protein